MARRVPRDQGKSFNENIASFRTSLGPIAARYSDAQLVQLRSDMRAAARLLLDLYLLKKRQATQGGGRAVDEPQTGT
jgi:hypothetical protein